MGDTAQHYAALQELNRNYIRSVDEADVAWFDRSSGHNHARESRG